MNAAPARAACQACATVMIRVALVRIPSLESFSHGSEPTFAGAYFDDKIRRNRGEFATLFNNLPAISKVRIDLYAYRFVGTTHQFGDLCNDSAKGFA